MLWFRAGMMGDCADAVFADPNEIGFLLLPNASDRWEYRRPLSQSREKSHHVSIFGTPKTGASGNGLCGSLLCAHGVGKDSPHFGCADGYCFGHRSFQHTASVVRT